MTTRWFLVAPVVAAFSLIFSSAALSQHAHGDAGNATPQAKATAAVAPIKPAPPGALPALPQVPFPPARPMAVVQQVYEFAARHPEVLRYVPCFCGCERGGHTGNHDCFVRRRAADGRIVEWEPHGIECQVCIDVGRDAMMLFTSGASISAIRDAIDKYYRPHFPSATPTPAPPSPRRKT